MNFNSQEYLAKLLAKENLTVQHGNYQTASFDVVNRVLRLPLWKDQGKDVYDLLVGHEVGHALYTPADGWHDSDKEIPGVPRSYINIIEDIRIEKMIQRTYPGIVRAFKSGYKKLFDSNLFGTDDRDINKASFMDRVNVHSKGRGYLPVEFTQLEQLFVDMAMAVETWDDVLNACREINDFVKAKEDYEDEDKEECSQGTPSEDGIEEENETEGMSQDDSGDESDDSGSSEGQSGSIGDGEEAEPESDTFTDDAFRENQEQLLEQDENGRAPQYSTGISDNRLKDMLVPYAMLKEARLENRWKVSECYSHADSYTQYDALVKEVKPIVNLMAKDFERKKAAWEYSRSSEAKKGSLNVNKLHQYQYSEDIFLTVQQLAQAKSHGIVMLVDWSGSMQDIALDTIKQTIMIGMFCKRVNIPFEAYSYTTGKNLGETCSELGDNEMENTHNTKIVQVLSSSMKKVNFDEAARHLYATALAVTYRGPFRYQDVCAFDRMGSTPTIQTLVASADILTDFRKKHGVQKLNVMLLTDGAADSYWINNDYDRDRAKTTSEIMFKFKNKSVRGDNSAELVAGTIQALKEITGANVLGFFLAKDKRDFAWAFRSYVRIYDSVIYDKNLKEFNKNGVVTYNNVDGYNEFFIVKLSNRQVVDEFEVKDKGHGIEIKDIKREFRKFNKNRKNSKQLVNKITNAVAA